MIILLFFLSFLTPPLFVVLASLYSYRLIIKKKINYKNVLLLAIVATIISLILYLYIVNETKNDGGIWPGVRYNVFSSLFLINIPGVLMLINYYRFLKNRSKTLNLFIFSVLMILVSTILIISNELTGFFINVYFYDWFF